MLKKLRLLRSYFYCKRFRIAGNKSYIAKGLVVKNGKYISIGQNCYLGAGCRLEAWDEYAEDVFTPSIILEDNVHIRGNCHVGAIGNIIIRKDVLLGSNVMIIDHDHGNGSLDEVDIHPSNRKLYSKGNIDIGERCWIGENAVILSGVTIGSGTTIGANSVVTKSLPANCVACGAPARVVKIKTKLVE